MHLKIMLGTYPYIVINVYDVRSLFKQHFSVSLHHAKGDVEKTCSSYVQNITLLKVLLICRTQWQVLPFFLRKTVPWYRKTAIELLQKVSVQQLIYYIRIRLLNNVVVECCRSYIIITVVSQFFVTIIINYKKYRNICRCLLDFFYL